MPPCEGNLLFDLAFLGSTECSSEGGGGVRTEGGRDQLVRKGGAREDLHATLLALSHLLTMFSAFYSLRLVIFDYGDLFRLWKQRVEDRIITLLKSIYWDSTLLTRMVWRTQQAQKRGGRAEQDM